MPAEEARVVDKVRLKLVGFESGLGLSVGRPNLSFETCNINTVKYTFMLMHLSYWCICQIFYALLRNIL